MGVYECVVDMCKCVVTVLMCGEIVVNVLLMSG